MGRKRGNAIGREIIFRETGQTWIVKEPYRLSYARPRLSFFFILKNEHRVPNTPSNVEVNA